MSRQPESRKKRRRCRGPAPPAPQAARAKGGWQLALLLSLIGLVGLPACEDEPDPEKVAYSGLKYTGRGRGPLLPEPTGTATASSDEGDGSGSKGGYKGGGSAPAGSKTYSSASVDACCSALNAQAADQTGETKERTKTAARLCVNLAHQVRLGQVTAKSAFIQLRSSAPGTLPASCMR